MSDNPRENFERSKATFDKLVDQIDIEAKQKRKHELELVSSTPDFWDDPQEAQKTMQQLGQLVNELDTIDSIREQIETLEEFLVFEDQSMAAEIAARLEEMEKQVESLRMHQIFSGRYDHHDALLSIHAGAGGTDASDWAEMLMRMYLRYCDQKGWTTSVLNLMPADEAGIKSSDIQIQGELVYGHMKAEHGVHRLVRLSPFNTKHTRETSFVLIEVVPLLGEVGDVKIEEDDLRIDVYRSSGHGGQSVNTTDSAVRITHLPTGITVACQNERSQHQNKQIAMNILRSKLAVQAEEKRAEEIQKTKGSHKQGSWGNQIRSYVMHPYTMVKDHRTEHETSEVSTVLNGNLDEFIQAWLLQSSSS